MENSLNEIPLDEIEDNNLVKPQFFLLIYNIKSKHNVDSLVRSAISFGCKKIFVLGHNKKVITKITNNELYCNLVSFEYFSSVEQIINYTKKNNINILGVEIGENSIPIQNYSFKGDTLFILGNEGSGMNKNQKDMCNQFVYIQQYSQKTGSLNVAMAASIIFYHFVSWAEYK